MNAKSVFKKTLKICISTLVLLGILLTSAPPIEVTAAPVITNYATVQVPIFVGSGAVSNDYLTIYAMRDTNSGRPVYCTRKGQALPQSRFALQPMI